jgi:hypothetical protein
MARCFHSALCSETSLSVSRPDSSGLPGCWLVGEGGGGGGADLHFSAGPVCELFVSCCWSLGVEFEDKELNYRSHPPTHTLLSGWILRVCLPVDYLV